MSTRTPYRLTIAGLLALPLALFLLLPALSHGAGAQQQLAPGAQAPATQTAPPLKGAPPLVPPATAATPPSAPPPATSTASAAPSLPLPADWGLCQCISDKAALDFTCPGSADACQSSCGPHFSFKPDARCRQAAAATPAPTH